MGFFSQYLVSILTRSVTRTLARALSCALVLTWVGCLCQLGSSEIPEPEVDRITPSAGTSDEPQKVTIRGENLLPKVVQDLAQEQGLAVDTTFKAWLGETKLKDVVYVDDQHLKAVVPAGLAPGKYKLKVETPNGLSAERKDVYTVATAMVISQVSPSDVVNDATETITVSGHNFTLDLAAAIQRDTSDPVTLQVANVTDEGFTATVPANLPVGTYTLRVSQAGGLNGVLASALRVWEPALLGATFEIAATTVNVNQEFPITLRVRNSGGSTASGVAVAAPTLGGTASVTLTSGPDPTQANIVPGGFQDFVWSYTASTAGSLTFTAQAQGENAFSQRVVSSASVSSSTLNVGQAAVLEVETLASPLSPAVGQTFTVALRVTNSGGADATSVEPTVVASHSNYVEQLSGPIPRLANVPVTETTSFVYTFRAVSPGTLHMTGSAVGYDANSGAEVTATPTVSPDVSILLGGAELVGSFSVPTTVSVGQEFVVQYIVNNIGGRNAITVRPTVQPPQGTGGATLVSGPTPNSAAINVQQSKTFELRYSATALGTVSFTGSASGTDEVSAQTVDAPPTLSSNVSIQGPAELALDSVVASATTVHRGQSQVAVQLEISNSGGTAVDLNAGGLVFLAAGSDVSSHFLATASGGNPSFVGANGSATLEYSVQVASWAQLGAIEIDGTINGTDRNSGATLFVPNSSVTDSWTVVANSVPQACFSGSLTAVAIGETVEFDAGCSSDVEDASSALLAQWDFNNDGIADVQPSTSKTIEHSFSSSGIYTVSLSIEDSQGARAYAATRIVVVPQATLLTVTTGVDEDDAGELAQPPHEGAGLSLREALSLANNTAGQNTVRFDPTVFLTSGTTIVLSGSAPPAISQPLQLVGHAGVNISAVDGLPEFQAANNLVAHIQISDAAAGASCFTAASGASNNWIFDTQFSNCDTAMSLSSASNRVGPNNTIDTVGLGLDATGSVQQVSGNRWSNCSNTCLRLASGTFSHVIELNQFQTGAVALEVQDATGVLVYHNTVVDFADYGVTLGGSDHQVINNIFVDNIAGAICDNSALTSGSSRSNLLFDNGPATGCVAACGNCLTEDPLFTNAASGDLSLQPTSPCIDSGENTGVDCNQTAPGYFFSHAPDLGAVEKR